MACGARLPPILAARCEHLEVMEQQKLAELEERLAGRHAGFRGLSGDRKSPRGGKASLDGKGLPPANTRLLGIARTPP